MKGEPFKQMVLGQLDIHMHKHEIRPSPQINSIWIIELNVGAKQ